MKILFKTAVQHPTHFTLVICSHLLIFILMIYCITSSIFDIFHPTLFTPDVYNTSEYSDANNPDDLGTIENNESNSSPTTMERLEELYANGTRYIECNIPTLYYTGYDSTSYNKVTGHYYYSLDNSTCTIYLLSSDILKNYETVPIILTDISFKAKLSRNDANIKSLLRYISTDINWNYYNLSQCTSSVVIDEVHCSLTTAVTLLIALIVLAFANIFQIINIWYRYFRRKS